MINVILANGVSLVQGVAAWTVEYTTTPGDTVAVLFNGPGGVQQDITDTLVGGKLAALIMVRDKFIPQYQENLDNLARDLISAVNQQHTQGVGLELVAELTGSYVVHDSTDPLNATGLPFGDLLTDGSFEIHVERDGFHLAGGTILVAPGMSLDDLIDAINTNVDVGPYLTASLDGNRLHISANLASDTFGFARDDSQILAALGLNTFFTGDKAYTLTVNPWVLHRVEYIASGQFDPNGARAVGDNRNALALAALSEAQVGPGNLTFAEAYRRLVTMIGMDAEQADQEALFQQKLVEQLTQMRDAISGVSLDEELSNLIKFQRAYQAAARLISVADELYQTLLSLRR
jgi:flagellar hook-associated protein 1 FlgK